MGVTSVTMPSSYNDIGVRYTEKKVLGLDDGDKVTSLFSCKPNLVFASKARAFPEWYSYRKALGLAEKFFESETL